MLSTIVLYRMDGPSTQGRNGTAETEPSNDNESQSGNRALAAPYVRPKPGVPNPRSADRYRAEEVLLPGREIAVSLL